MREARIRSVLLAFACGGLLGTSQCGLTERNPPAKDSAPATVAAAGAPEPALPEVDAAVDAAPVDAMTPTPPDASLPDAPEMKPDPARRCPAPQPASAPREHRFQVQWDYRYDSHGFLTETPRALLLEAARIWGDVVHSDFASVPAGTEVLMRNPERPDEAGSLFKIEYDIDDLALFVAAARFDGPGGQTVGLRDIAALGSVTNPTEREALRSRYTQAAFQPWTAWISFDADEPWFFDPTPETDDDLPPDQLDFLTVAVGSLGQTLGIGGSDAFARLVDQDGAFIGCAAMAAYGGPVPLGAMHAYIQEDVLSDGRRPIFTERNRVGERNVRPTSLDLAMLVDLGYEVGSAPH